MSEPSPSLSLSDAEVVPEWQSPDDASLQPKRLDFLLSEKHEDVMVRTEAMRQCETFRFVGTKHPNGTAKERCVELSLIVKEQALKATRWRECLAHYQRFPEQHPNKLINRKRLKEESTRIALEMEVLEDSLYKLHHTLKTPSNMSCMYVANAMCGVLQRVHAKAFAYDVDHHYVVPLSWYMAEHQAFFVPLEELVLCLGMRMSPEWMVQCFDKQFVVACDKHTVSEHVKCAICQSPLGTAERGIGFQRRCGQYPFTQFDEDWCAGHECRCAEGVFHLQCLAVSFYHDSEARYTWSKCPLCNAQYCLADLVGYKVERTHKKQKLKE